jgi:transcription initiation factor TFIIIB Brf1 subunit/transcription initiation factor TFIIB
VEEIRRLRGTATQRALAAQFGVTDATIRDIYSGKSWSSTAPELREFTPQEVRFIRKLRGKVHVHKIASMLQASESSVWRVSRGLSYRDVA